MYQEPDLTASSEFKKKEEKLEYNPTLDFQGENVLRSDTPETILPELIISPDISLECEKCKAHVHLRNLKDHRVFHNALETLKYMGSNRPSTIEALLRRRNAVLRKMKKAATADKPIERKDVTKINDAYEYLKAEIDGTFGELRKVKEKVDATVSGTALSCSPACVYAVGMCTNQNQRWKSYMEDAHVVIDSLGEDKNKCYVGIFDGHHGRFSADAAASQLHHLLVHEMSQFDPKSKSDLAKNLEDSSELSRYDFENTDENIHTMQQIIKLCEDKYQEIMEQKPSKVKKFIEKPEENENKEEQVTPRKKKKEQKSPFTLKMEHAFFKTYYLLDILLSYGKDERSRVRWSGCSGCTVVVQDLGEYNQSQGGKPADEGGNDSDKENKTSLPQEKEESKFDPPRDIGMLYLANAGNVQAVLVRANKVYKLTKDHTPNNTKEKERVLKNGGDISDSTKEMRVNGILSATRGLGNHGDVRLKKCVLVDPHTMAVPVDQYAQFVLVASQGVWEVFTEQEAASLLLKLLPNNLIPPPSRPSTTLKPLLEDFCSQGLLSARSSHPSQRRVSFSQLDDYEEFEKDDDDDDDDDVEIDELRELKSPLKSSSRMEDHETADSPKQSDKERLKSAESAKTQTSKKSESKSVAFSEKSVKDVSSNSENQNGLHKNVGTGMDEDFTESFKPPMIELEGGDSGNEADVETDTDRLTMPNLSSLSSRESYTKEYMQREFAKAMSEHLVQAALLAGSKDNISVSVILLSGSGL